MHRFAVHVRARERSFPRHLRRARLKRTRVPRLRRDLVTRVVNREDEPTNGLIRGAQLRDARTPPGVHTDRLFGDREGAKGPQPAVCQQRTDATAQDIDGSAEGLLFVRRQRRQACVATRDELCVRFGGRGCARENAGREDSQFLALRRREVHRQR